MRGDGHPLPTPRLFAQPSVAPARPTGERRSQPVAGAARRSAGAMGEGGEEDVAGAVVGVWSVAAKVGARLPTANRYVPP